jgi:hypothetical protein
MDARGALLLERRRPHAKCDFREKYHIDILMAIFCVLEYSLQLLVKNLVSF